MARHQPAARTPLALEPASGKKGLDAARQTRGAQEGDGVGHAVILGAPDVIEGTASDSSPAGGWPGQLQKSWPVFLSSDRDRQAA
jgi:hypothetical protein